MKILSVIPILLVFFGFSACQIESKDLSSGCASDDDCRFNRVCVDKICLFAEDVKEEERAEDIGYKFFLSLVQREVRVFAVTIPEIEDLNWGFDWYGDHNPALTDLDRYDQLLYELEEDFFSVLQSNDFTDAEYVGFEAGSYVPIQKGENRALQNLDTLANSKLVYTKGGQTYRMNIARLVRLRGRWKIFYLYN